MVWKPRVVSPEDLWEVASQEVLSRLIKATGREVEPTCRIRRRSGAEMGGEERSKVTSQKASGSLGVSPSGSLVPGNLRKTRPQTSRKSRIRNLVQAGRSGGSRDQKEGLERIGAAERSRAKQQHRRSLGFLPLEASGSLVLRNPRRSGTRKPQGDSGREISPPPAWQSPGLRRLGKGRAGTPSLPGSPGGLRPPSPCSEGTVF